MPVLYDPTLSYGSGDATGDARNEQTSPGPTGLWGRYVVLGQIGAGSMGIVLVAHDPALDRKVALKVLRPRDDRSASVDAARINLEAQAMARLAHPNVVTVFDVDHIGEQAFVAMELVEGSTLRGWLQERRRAWRDIVAMFIAAGRGLAAAHAAGLVHRDFKPDNVLIGSDGRPRVSDFGLVVEASGEAPVLEPAPDGVDVTTRGTAAGTPAYMSPEQWSGRALDARSDQFAFCVALWEALFVSRPFSGATLPELRAAVRAGTIATPPGRPRTPGRLIAALRRGLAADPAARWPDMTSLVEELTRMLAARQRWTVAAIVSAAAVASAALAVAVVGIRAAPDPCQPPAARVAAVWSAARREALGAKLAAIDPGQGAARFARIAAAIDAGAERWSAMHVEACRATRVEGRQSELLFDRRIACLDRWLGELADTVGVAERAGDRSEVDQAVRAGTALSPLAACADARALSEAPPLPSGAAERATAIALAQRTQQLEVEQRAGRIAGLPSKIRDAVAAARALDHAPTLAAALVVQARVDFATEDHLDAESVLRELAQVAARARDDRSAAFAWIQLVVTIGNDEGKRSEGGALIPMATAAVLRAGDSPDLRADLLFSQALLEEHEHPPAALALLTRARTLLEQAGAAIAGSPLASRLIKTMSYSGALHGVLGDNLAAIASYRDAIERWRALYGNDSPDEAREWGNLAIALGAAGRHDEEIAAYHRALAIQEARLGESPMTAFSREVLAMALHMLGRWDEALEIHDQAVRTYRAQVPADDARLTRTLGNRAATLVQAGRFDEAARGYAEVLALLERDGSDTADLALTLINRGELYRKRGRGPDALRDYTRSAGLAESLHEAGAGILINALVGEAACLLDARRYDDAIARLHRALALKTDEAFPQALARAYLGRAQVETRRDVAGGLAAVRSARAGLAAAAASDAGNAAALREIDAWLAAHANTQ